MYPQQKKKGKQVLFTKAMSWFNPEMPIVHANKAVLIAECPHGGYLYKPPLKSIVSVGQCACLDVTVM